MFNKKIFFSVVIVLFISITYFFYTNLTLTNPDNPQNESSFNKALKNIIPQNIKEFIKDTIFVFKKIDLLELRLEEQKKYYRNKINELNERITFQKKSTQDLVKLLDAEEKFIFTSQEARIKSFGDNKVSIKKYTLPLLTNTGPRAYLNYYNKNLFLITGSGILMYSSISNLKEDNLEFKRIDTNFDKFIKLGPISEHIKTLVKNILIKDNKIYLSYVKDNKGNYDSYLDSNKFQFNSDDCYMNSILVADLNFSKIEFTEFFSTNACKPIYDNHAGGNLYEYKSNYILMTTGDFNSYEKPEIYNPNEDINGEWPQNKESLVGKIISINETNKEYKILSMGHRNPQGLYYDKINDIIFSTEHGPQGGDEVNINFSPEKELKNFGWAISSYGDHYGFPDKDNRDKYEIAPLYKSHSDYGFIEPAKYFKPSIGITQITKTEEFIKLKNKHVLYVGSMGWDLDEQDLSLHQLIYNDDFVLEEHNVMAIEERIRDIIYIKEINQILLFLETSGSIAVLNSVN